MRDLAVAVAEEILGFHVERVFPAWYGREVLLFFVPGQPLVVYSYDENACNAIMFCNGIDRTNGIAPPLPFYDTQIEDAWEVVEAARELPGFLEAISGVFLLDSEDAARSICEEALKAARQAATPR